MILLYGIIAPNTFYNSLKNDKFKAIVIIWPPISENPSNFWKIPSFGRFAFMVNAICVW